MKTNCKRIKDLRLATRNERSLYRPGGPRITINELRKYQIAIAAIQETRWNKLTPQLASDWWTLPQAGKWHSSDGPTFNQIDYCLIDGRYFSDVIDVMARKGGNIDSDYMLGVTKLRARIYRADNTKPQQLRRFAVNRLKDRDVASRDYDDLESDLQGVQPQPLSLDEKCKILEKTSK
jgi:hypothetical protein